MAARIEADRGNLQGAIKQMRALVAEKPNYYQGWQYLADWYRENGPSENYIEAASALVRIAPQYHIAWGYLGDAQLAANDLDGAKEAFGHAIALVPGYEFAARNLFELQLEANDFEGAGKTLQVIHQHFGEERAALCELYLHVRRKDRTAARSQFRVLCLSGASDRNYFDAAVGKMRAASWEDVVDQVLEEVLFRPEANPIAGAVWAERCGKRGAWQECEETLGLLPERNELWKRAFVVYLEGLTKVGLKQKVRHSVSKYGKELRSDTKTWGSVGYVLFSVGESYEAVNWLSDWTERPYDCIELY